MWFRPVRATRLGVSGRLFALMCLLLCVSAGCDDSEKRPTPKVSSDDIRGSIVFATQVDKHKLELAAVPVGGGHSRALGALPAAAWALSPDRTQIAYVQTTSPSAGDFFSELWVADLDNGDAARLVHSAIRLGSPAWSPDGRRIAYGDGLGTSIAQADGSGTSQIALSQAEDLDWSPDGRLLVASGLESHGIIVVDIESGSERTLTTAFGDSSPRWSPDGSEIAFTRSNLVGQESSIYIVGAGGGVPRRVTSEHADRSPSWSPDGELIAFSRSPLAKGSARGDLLDVFARQDRLSELFVMGADGSGLRRLTHNQVPDRSPEWGDPEAVSHSVASPQDLGTVPDVTGLSEAAARSKLAARGFRVTLRNLGFAKGEQDPFAENRVVAQAPSAGARAARGRIVQLLVVDQSDRFAGRAFDAAVWRRHPTCESDNPRGRMYANLVQKYLPRGTSQARVIELLGKPERREPNRFEYPLGAWSGFRLDCDYLTIEFNKGQRVAATSHVQS